MKKSRIPQNPADSTRDEIDMPAELRIQGMMMAAGVIFDGAVIIAVQGVWGGEMKKGAMEEKLQVGWHMAFRSWGVQD